MDTYITYRVSLKRDGKILGDTEFKTLETTKSYINHVTKNPAITCNVFKVTNYLPTVEEVNLDEI